MSSWLQKQSNPKLYRQHSSSSIPTSNGGPKPTAQNTKEQKPIIEIYTDWANHYLDKLKGRTKIRDLQTELYDGLVLADVIEAVTNEKVPDVVRKPGKNVNAQIGNIQASLNFLLSKGIQVIDIRASEIHGGSLKAILGLFFQLSRFKQQQKQIQQHPSKIGRPHQQGITMTLTMTTTPQQQHGSSIPSPTKKATSGRLTAPTTPTKVPCMSHLKPPKVVKSFEKNQQASQIRAPKILGLGPEQKGIGKRTSSSSGFSSPRSVSSSGSSNMSSDTNFPSPSALRRISEIKPPPPNQPPPASLPTRNGIIPTTKSHLPKSSAIARNSPKRSPKFPRSSDTEIKDYGLIDSKAPYPPHAGGKSFIATPSMRIPPKSITIKQLPVLPPQGCTVRPLQQKPSLEESAKKPTELPSSTLLTSSSKTCSLPRRRREDSSPGPAAVAVVSPMPCNNKSEILQQPQDISAKERNNSINEDEEDPLKCIEPMKPLGLFTKSPNGPSHHLPFSGSNVVKRNPLSIHQQQEGFLKNKSPRSVAVESGYMSDGGDLIFNASNGSTFEDGYMSEGGMSFYARKLYQTQGNEHVPDILCQTESLKQHRQQQQLLQQQQNGGGMYRVIGGRKHVQKSDSSFQTEPVSYNKEYDWKKAMAHNARILSSQEKAMDEYLRRQRAVAKQQLHMNKDSRHRSIGTKEDGRGSSIPGTPVMEPRRNYSSSLERSNKKVYREFERSNAGVASPMSSRKNYSQQPNNKDNALLGSKSLPKGSSSLNYGLMLDRIQQKRQHRPSSKNDGSLSDSNYATYSEIQGNRGGSSSPYSWLQPASTYANSVVDPYSAWNDVSSSEAMGSTESLNSVSSSIQHARANSVTKAKLMMMHHQQKISPGNPHGRNIEKQLNHQSETEYYGIPVRPSATPTSINLNRAKNIPKSKFKSAEDNLSPRPSYIFASSNYGNSNSNNNKNNNNNIIKNEGIKNKSETPLIHAPSKLSKEEQTNCDIIKLKKELDDEHDKVKNLTSQLATNSHVVAAFQQSLTNMSNRLHHLTLTAEQKDSELNDLRQTIDKIRQSGVDVGLISSNHPGDLCRQMSSDSFLSDVSDSEDRPDGKKKSKRSGWLRHSFSKAFSRNHANKIKSKGGSLSDAEDGSITKALYEQEVNNRCSSAASVVQPEIKGSQSSSALDDDAKDGKDLVSQLQRQLMEKDELLTETRLEALSSAHQLEALRETVSKMRSELACLKNDNEKLNSLVPHRTVPKSSSSSSISSSRHSLAVTEEGEDSVQDIVRKRHSSHVTTDSSMFSGHSSLDLSSTTDPTHKDGGKLVSVSVCGDGQDTRIGVIAVSGKSTWELLESLIQRLFKEYVMRVDHVSNLGLASDSISHYQVGEIRRSKRNSANPEMLPYGYLVGDTTDIKVYLRKSVNHVDSLAFETLIPKSLVQRYVSLLMEHRRIILSGPTGTGKTFIAKKLANFLVQRKRESVSSPIMSPSKIESVANFIVNMNNVNELREYLSGISDKCNSASEKESLPTVIVLDNLHLAGQLDEVFNEFLKASFDTCPYIIGTLNQTTTSAATTHLQLKHNFRWILCANHMEPVRGFLGRYLRRKLLVVETATRIFDAEMSSIVDWIAKVYSHLNKFLETHSSCGDITFGPRHFLNCPIDIITSRNWFVNLWNTVLIPYMTDALREAIQLYGKRASWEDPFSFVKETWPWPGGDLDVEELSRIKPEDVGFDMKNALPSRPNSSIGGDSLLIDELSSPTSGDPLFNMLMHLQEAAANNETKRDDQRDEDEEDEEIYKNRS
ncbi:uncharacterized protein sick [Lepeophtheirus salmonis]|uniref:Neuron navigator 2like [Saccoglossus kowalevskii] n=1 Tax=Lepeophtheirus salmonis TaxID=72036 RepID=A0A0K2TIB3_LEPSM|nr:neuron navigator 3-like [Lepeophtheirus salmonis]